MHTLWKYTATQKFTRFILVQCLCYCFLKVMTDKNVFEIIQTSFVYLLTQMLELLFHLIRFFIQLWNIGRCHLCSVSILWTNLLVQRHICKLSIQNTPGLKNQTVRVQYTRTMLIMKSATCALYPSVCVGEIQSFNWEWRILPYRLPLAKIFPYANSASDSSLV